MVDYRDFGQRVRSLRRSQKLTQEELAEKLAKQGIAVRAGLHCAPLAHESAGTLETGTVRVSFGVDACPQQIEALRRGILTCGLR